MNDQKGKDSISEVVSDANPDPIIDVPGYPVGTMMGAASGAIVSGPAAKGIAEAIDPTSEAAYWHDHFKDRYYAPAATDFDDSAHAYGYYGVMSYVKSPGCSFEEVESDLSRNWNTIRGKSILGWDKAWDTARDAWGRISHQ